LVLFAGLYRDVRSTKHKILYSHFTVITAMNFVHLTSALSQIKKKKQPEIGPLYIYRSQNGPRQNFVTLLTWQRRKRLLAQPF